MQANQTRVTHTYTHTHTHTHTRTHRHTHAHAPRNGDAWSYTIGLIPHTPANTTDWRDTVEDMVVLEEDVPDPPKKRHAPAEQPPDPLRHKVPNDNIPTADHRGKQEQVHDEDVPTLKWSVPLKKINRPMGKARTST